MSGGNQTIIINVYNDTASGHVSITLPSGTYEQTWTGGSVKSLATNLVAGGGLIGGLALTAHSLFSSDSGQIDGETQLVLPNEEGGLIERLPALRIPMVVSGTQTELMEAFVQGQLMGNDYGLTSNNCVAFVDTVLGSGYVENDWRLRLQQMGGLPGNVPIEYLLAPSDSERESGVGNGSNPNNPIPNTPRPTDTTIQTSRDIIGGKLVDKSTGKVVYADEIIRKVAAAQTEREAQIAAAQADRDR
jgi:hypothetical protein